MQARPSRTHRALFWIYLERNPSILTKHLLALRNLSLQLYGRLSSSSQARVPIYSLTISRVRQCYTATMKRGLMAAILGIPGHSYSYSRHCWECVIVGFQKACAVDP